ncbi:MAG: DNA primase [Microgenomates group bacterium Gr01-1014_16]|nr:MAG: DNA primase [Microgenomates group bacterium Gr01-1014_16]
MDQVEEIKQKVDIVELVQEYVQLKRAGRNFKGLCPFHGEKTPSFMVNPELQIFKCFGCNEGGDCYSFLQKIEGMEFGEALQTLAKRVGVTLESYRPSGVEEVREKLIGINTLAAQAYHYLLTKHKSGKKALEYLKDRGISEESVEKFNLGYAPDEWEFLTKYMGKKNIKIDDLRRAGLVVEGKSYDRFRNRIIFPLANARGQVMGFAGRILDGEGQAKYVNTPETEIYHKSELLYGLDITRSEIKHAGWAVIVEGEIDMIASWQSGVTNVVAIKGSALTERQVEILRRICDTVVLALDADVAGDSAARRGIEIADKNGLMVKMVRLSGAKDPGELAIQKPEEWKKAVKEAIPIYDFYIESAVTRHGLEIAGKKKIGQELLPIWAGISDEIVKAHYIRQLAKVLDVGEDDIRVQLAKTLNSKHEILNKSQIPNFKSQKSRREVREERLILMALLGKKTKELGKISWIKTDFWRRVVERIDDLPSELKGRVQELMLTDEEFSEKKWEEAKDLLELVDIEERMVGDDTSKIGELSRRKAELTRNK